MVDVLVNGSSPRGLLVFAHGAGQPMDSPTMEAVVDAFCASGDVTAWRFEFPYMAGRRTGGTKRPPDRAPILLATWAELLTQARQAGWANEQLIIGGKSMGGRMATMVADQEGVAGFVCVGYPFHPPGKPEALRTEHLLSIQTPGLICQGERDPFGTAKEVPEYGLAKSIELSWAPDGNHDLKPRKKSGYTHEDNVADAARAFQAFCRRVL